MKLIVYIIYTIPKHRKLKKRIPRKQKSPEKPGRK